MGVVIILALAVGLFVVLKVFMHWPLALLVAFAFLAVALFIVRRPGTRGLYRSNIKAYLTAKSVGYSHDDALRFMLVTRYPRSLETQVLIWQTFSGLRSRPGSSGEGRDVVDVVHEIFVWDHKLFANPVWNQSIFTNPMLSGQYREGIWREYRALTGTGPGGTV